MNKFSKVIFFNVLLLLAIGFSGCGSTASNGTAKDTKPADNKPAVNSQPEKKPEDTKTSDVKTEDAKPDSKPETASTGDKIGVPECDEYVEKYEACVFSKVPESMRGAFKSSFEAQRKAWKDAAANPQAKASLASGCKQALETSKQALASYKCDW